MHIFFRNKVLMAAMLQTAAHAPLVLKIYFKPTSKITKLYYFFKPMIQYKYQIKKSDLNIYFNVQ
jgi:hypothetical protein